MRYQFSVGKSAVSRSTARMIAVRLRRNTWDDYHYGTTFDVDIERDGDWETVGVTKIGRRGFVLDAKPRGTTFVDVPTRFERLDDSYFSVGQDAQFYENLVTLLGSSVARGLLRSLRDMSESPQLVLEVADEPVLGASVMRSISTRNIEQYRRIILGDLEKRSFAMTYTLSPDALISPAMTFEVARGKKLPSNVHVLIGSNGTGKTTTLLNIKRAFEDAGTRGNEYVSLDDREQIAGLVSVSFSAFDTPAPTRESRDQLRFRITDVRLPAGHRFEHESLSTSLVDTQATLRNRSIGNHVQSEILGCLAERPERLLTSFRLLGEADPLLGSYRIDDELSLRALDFEALSSGHKIALLTIASLVRYCDERTLVLLDEPESHLHPPLLAAVTRVISDLMTSINGLTIVATHSPVVLQEVPRRCAWIIWNLGGGARVARPSIETFGANLGVLTREVFDLELSKSGYHALLREVAANASTYSDALAMVDGEIGDEAKMLLRSMVRREGDR
ncbi:hypothetical protein SRABI128_01078 [Microbacterium sp. Bi128]|nr:hypothetical protein SRABI128_01078 [Microbacterium sp. Bi128]